MAVTVSVNVAYFVPCGVSHEKNLLTVLSLGANDDAPKPIAARPPIAMMIDQNKPRQPDVHESPGKTNGCDAMSIIAKMAKPSSKMPMMIKTVPQNFDIFFVK